VKSAAAFCPRHVGEDQPCGPGCVAARVAFGRAAKRLDVFWTTDWLKPLPKRHRRRGRLPRINTSAEPWSPAEELRLRELAGTMQRDELARTLSREFGVPRTVSAICIRAKLLDISLAWDGYSQSAIAELFGVSCATVGIWGKTGLLPYRVWEGGGRSRFGEWHVERADLLAFIDRYPWAYALEPMRRSPLRSRAEVAHRAQRWLTCKEAARAVGMTRETLARYVREGMVPHERRVAGLGQPKIMMRAADLPGLRERLREHALGNLREAIRTREERRKAKAA
jgi:hypothetical protein